MNNSLTSLSMHGEGTRVRSKLKTFKPVSEAKTKRKPLRAIGQLFNYRWLLKNIHFFLFLSGLAVLYIANGHMADNRIRRINDTGRKLKDLQYEYKTLKSEIMFKSRESEMVKASEPLGLRLDSIPPVRIELMSRKTN